jgi:hypothetical protein
MTRMARVETVACNQVLRVFLPRQKAICGISDGTASIIDVSINVGLFDQRWNRPILPPSWILVSFSVYIETVTEIRSLQTSALSWNQCSN